MVATVVPQPPVAAVLVETATVRTVEPVVVERRTSGSTISMVHSSVSLAVRVVDRLTTAPVVREALLLAAPEAVALRVATRLVQQQAVRRTREAEAARHRPALALTATTLPTRLWLVVVRVATLAATMVTAVAVVVAASVQVAAGRLRRAATPLVVAVVVAPTMSVA